LARCTPRRGACTTPVAVTEQPDDADVLSTWRTRTRALRHVPFVVRLAWDSGRGVLVANLLCRLAGAMLPVAMLGVGKTILDAVQQQLSTGYLRPDFWALVVLEGGLATLGATLGRAGGFIDALLADRFARHVSLRVMEHAARLDLETYDNPAFHDTLERARAQATDRIATVHALGALFQQGIVVVTLSASIFYFSPWLLVLLTLALLPAFVGESHFAALGYALSLQQTPLRRWLDYLRLLGASRDTAKELRLFGLAPFITNEYAQASDALYAQNTALARRRLWAGAVLSIVSTASYYGAYAYVLYRTVHGELTWGSLQFLAGAIGGASSGIQSLLATLSSVADQALFVTDLVTFFQVQPTCDRSPTHGPCPGPSGAGSRSRTCRSRIPAIHGPCSSTSTCTSAWASAWRSLARTVRARRRW
jgi:ATP-binding cassette subfamily B protein